MTSVTVPRGGQHRDGGWYRRWLQLWSALTRADGDIAGERLRARWQVPALLWQRHSALIVASIAARRQRT